MIIDHESVGVFEWRMSVRVAVRLGSFRSLVVMIMVPVMRVPMVVHLIPMEMREYFFILFRPEQCGQCREYQHAAGQDQCRGFDTDPETELPRNRIKNQPADM